jgi:hypothetical protein
MMERMTSGLAAVVAWTMLAPEVGASPPVAAAPTAEAAPPVEAAPPPVEAVAPPVEAAPPPADAVAPPADVAPPPAEVAPPTEAAPVALIEPDSVPPPAPASEWGPEDLAPPQPPVIVRTDSGYALVAISTPPPVPPVPPDVTIRKWNRSAGVLMGVSAATFLGALALQGVRVAAMSSCSHADEYCQADVTAMDPSLGTYTVLFHSMSVTGAGAAGAMLGRGRATGDVQIHRRVDEKRGMIAGGLALAIGGGLTYVVGGLGLYARQTIADDPASVQRRRFLVLDATAIMTGVGAGLAAYGLAYRKHAKALSKIHLGASVGPGFSGLAASGRF